MPFCEGFELFAYPPLPRGEYTRRLLLEPGAAENPLVGHLETINLNEPSTPFEAISYAWGSDKKDQWIQLDGRRLPITTSLSDALRQVRWTDRPRAVWADAICINQENTPEKGHQVSQMARIYKLSVHTLICLGPGRGPQHRQHAHDAESLVADVNAMIQQTLGNPEFSWDWDAFPYPQGGDDALALAVDDRWHAWAELVHEPWFGRGWIIQEAVLASRAVVLWAGVEIAWVAILRAFRWLARRARFLLEQHHSKLQLTDCLISPILARTFELHQPREGRLFQPREQPARIEPLNALKLLEEARSSKVTNPKDRIYAFMALPTSDGEMPVLEPDYSDKISHLDVYRDFAVQFLAKNPTLDLLVCIQHNDNTFADTRLSSWVPRWNLQEQHVSDAFFDPSHRVLRVDPQRDSGSNARFSLSSGGQVLQVHAGIFDTIVYTSDAFDEGSSASVDAQGIIEMWQAFSTQQSSLLPGLYKQDGRGGSVTDSFLRTLTCSRSNGRLEEFQRCRREFCKLLESDRLQLRVTDAESWDAAQKIASSAAWYLHNRRFVQLGQGYFGLAPRITCVGDVCVMVDGAREPLIIRRVPGAGSGGRDYKVVGTAYVHTRRCNGFGQEIHEGCEDLRVKGLVSQTLFLH